MARISDLMDERYRLWYSEQVAIGSDTVEAFAYHLDEQLAGVDLDGKHVLEVGCGRGAVSMALALYAGVAEVVALDEAAGAGSPEGVIQTLRDAANAWSVENLTVEQADIMQSGLVGSRFDVIIANNALHHVAPSGFVSRDPVARDAYVSLFRVIGGLLRPGGLVSISELSRSCLWRFSPIKLRGADIDWELHPTVREFVQAMGLAGLEPRSISYQVPYRLRRLRGLLANPVGDFMLMSGFTIAAAKPVWSHDE